ncbi:MAG: hypothetical protein Q8867_08625 [Bacteroidota bacterium]|nr:hypothetical protein [Bacteroidota bacterium]
MKRFYQTMSRILIVLLVALIPLMSVAQQQQQKKKDEPKKETKKEAAPKKNPAPTNCYWAITLFPSLNQFNGDLSKNLWINDKWTLGGGVMATHQFGRTIGLRLKVAYTPLTGEVDKKFVYDYGDLGVLSNPFGHYISKKFNVSVWETDLQMTVNWVNWILGSKPDRFFSSYIILGGGLDHAKGTRINTLDHNTDAYLGNKDHTVSDDILARGNNDGIGKWDLNVKAITGIGFDFNLNKNWSINPEFVWRWTNSDALDMTIAGSKEIKNDMYSSFNLGITYKFAYCGCNIKQMAKTYEGIKYETTPSVLTEKGDSVTVTVKGTVPPKFFCERATMYWQPVVKYDGGTLPLKPVTLKGEKVTGDGIMIPYKTGGSFTYTTVFPYKPEMANSELVVAPIAYDGKGKVVASKDEIKAKYPNIEMPSRLLAPGIIYTDKRIAADMKPLVGDHGYVKDIIESKTGVIYYKVNVYNLDLKFGINKTDAAKDVLKQYNEFVKQGWKIKDITIDGWASPEGEETLNANLSENRAKTADTYMVDQFKTWMKEAEKGNKNKKEVKEKIANAAKDVNFVINHHGPDWNGFLKNVQASNIKDKDKILNVINSAGDNKKKEEEIRNMLVIYPELEEKMLPPLRRAEMTANLYKPSKSDEEISQLAVSSPDKLTAEEILYAGTLTNNNDTKLTIYENAVRVYPNNWKALNNAACANIEKGNYDKAASELQKAAAIAPNNGLIENNIGVVALKQGDLKKAETQFKKAQQLGENENYNMGTVAITKGDYQKANSQLANAKCTYNLGLAQLVAGNTAAAQTTLSCAPQSPETFYMLAVCGARAKDTKAMYENLTKAVTGDPKLKDQARNDKEFYNYANTQDFKNIVK